MTITANIDELDIDGIAMGMEVDITQSGAESDTHYTGTVTEISYEATNSNGVAYFPITITIPSGGALSAGVNVSYSITVGDESEGVLAPIAALKSTSQGTCLFVKADAAPDNAVELEDGVVPDGFYAVPVETGVSNSQYVRILSGVEEGVEVFTRYQQTARAAGIPPARARVRSNPASRAAGKCRISAAECLAAWAAGCPAAAYGLRRGILYEPDSIEGRL